MRLAKRVSLWIVLHRVIFQFSQRLGNYFNLITSSRSIDENTNGIASALALRE